MFNNTLASWNLRKVFLPVGGVVLGTAIMLGGMEITPISSNSDNAVSSPIVGVKPANAQSTLAGMERSVHQQINQYRRSRGLAPLKLDARISAIARKHSRRMASGRVGFGHSGSKSRYQQISRLIRYRGAAENVAYNQGHRNPGRSAVRGWIKSPGHHKNMVGRYQVTGIGIARNSKGKYYFTQLFARTR